MMSHVPRQGIALTETLMEMRMNVLAKKKYYTSSISESLGGFVAVDGYGATI